jgi:hypothetical protein
MEIPQSFLAADVPKTLVEINASWAGSLVDARQWRVLWIWPKHFVLLMRTNTQLAPRRNTQ